MRKGIVRTIAACVLLAGLLGFISGGAAQALVRCDLDGPLPLIYCVVVGDGTGGAAAQVLTSSGLYAQAYVHYATATGAHVQQPNGKYTGAYIFCYQGHYAYYVMLATPSPQLHETTRAC